ncbi:hypothetical protein EDC94DRAFT_608524 [Helicostylum pulchrum]|nr:hypothetical protein EDC94DRAFT_608524 [Helicostylum pulchrum]
MTKEPHQTPKAVNIIRPSSNYGLLHNTTSTSSSGSSNSGSLLQKRTGSMTSSTTRKLRVNSTSTKSEKPLLNLYHPPTRKPSYDDYHRMTVNSRPPIEIYKPHQQRLTKSFTAPSLSNEHTQPIQPTTRPISRASRSVLGPINTPVVINSNHIEKPQEQMIERIDDKSILDKNVETDESEEDEDENEEEYDDENDLENNDDEEEDDDNEEDEEEEEDEPVINEARVNRKIADLELSINSLLTVNAMLESTVRKQASQLSQMKSKMMSGESIDSLLDEVPIVDVQETTADENEEEDWDKDVLFQKLRKITEQMIEQGQKSIDFEYKILGRVLSNYAPQEEDDDDDNDEEEETTTLPSPSTSLNKSLTHPANNTQIPATSIPLISKPSKIAKKKNNA